MKLFARVLILLTRGISFTRRNSHKKEAPGFRGFFYKFGDYLLSHICSTIGADRFNFSVRNGKRWSPAAIVTLRSFRIWDFGFGPDIRDATCNPYSAINIVDTLEFKLIKLDSESSRVISTARL
jgi:hypothetical protein